MKREILFRGKRVDTGEWIYGDLIKNSIIDPFTYIAIGVGYKIDNPEIGKAIKVFPNTVGQFTGMTDKNGTKIFEGDILKFNTFRTKKYGGTKDIVKFEDYGFNPMNDLFYIDGECGDSIELDNNGNYIFEVIGNVFENKELLK